MTIGLVTALPKEFAATKAMLDDPVEYGVPGRGAGREYVLGEIPAKGGGKHVVALVRAGVGNNQAAARAALLLEHFPAMDALLMVGIAGGIPHPSKPEHHVRLGDIVVSDLGGVVQYDLGREALDPSGEVVIEPRHPPRPPGARLIEAVLDLEAAEYESQYPWEPNIARAHHLRASGRPSVPDELHATDDPSKIAVHPDDPLRRPGMPRVFRGIIASANMLLRNPRKRDLLRERFPDVKAVEMEGSGIADATWHHEVGYLVVRGICDYCDGHKGDTWQMYAAIVAAAYARTVLEWMRGPHAEATRQTLDVAGKGGATNDPRPLPASPRPQGADRGDTAARLQEITARLEDAHQRRQTLQEVGANADAIQAEILDLRRQLREGGQLRAADALGDGRYVLIRPLGRGGFATVWEAHDRRQDQRVALKVLHANLAGDALRRERFFRGARIMAQLGHPAVVRVMDPEGEDGGFYYFVMELVAGGDMRKAVLEGRLPKEKVIPLILQVGDALAEAHVKGFVHRDVKPGNILLDERGAARLTDFDLVAASDTTGGTRTGAMGTFIYAAPECLDRPQDADARADVYSLAMTAIFGFHGAELPMDVLRHAADFVETLTCQRYVKAVLKRGVEWRAQDRPRDAEAFCFSLRAALAYQDPREMMNINAPQRPADAPMVEASQALRVRDARPDESDVGQRSTGAFTLQIDWGDFGRKASALLAMTVGLEETFQSFLDSLWSDHMYAYVPMRTYGTMWTLVDANKQRAIEKREEQDHRPAVKAGIVPGARLIIRSLPLRLPRDNDAS